jgi:hypothetical protein
MGRRLWGLVALLAFVPALWADDKPKDKDKTKQEKPKTPAQQLQDLQAKIRQAGEAAQKSYTAAKTPEEKQKIIADYRKTLQGFGSSFLDLAKKHPKDESAIGAVQMALLIGVGPKEASAAVDLLVEHHLNSAKVSEVGQMLAQNGNPAGEKLLRAVIAKSKDHKAQAQASLALAELLAKKAENPSLKPAEVEKMVQEAETAFATIIKKYGDVGNVVQQAKEQLYVLQHLRIGKEAPDIVGEDIEGKNFKLSDYRGKVILIDFWGHW